MFDKIDGWLNICKPAGITSNYVSTSIKKKLGIKKHTIKIGFVGTLDPFATGVLPFALGGATKCIDILPNATKEYTFTAVWGAYTDTFDVDGEVLKTCDNAPNEEEIRAAIPEFIGDIMQSPPAFSAVKIRGQRACDRVRRGENISTTPRQISIYDIQILDHGCQKTTFSVKCKSGCYIRSLAVDLAKKLNTYCYVESLNRTRDGFFSDQTSIPLETFLKFDYNEAVACVIPIDEALDDIPAIRLNAADSEFFARGGFVPVDLRNVGTAKVFNDVSSKIIGIATVRGGFCRPRKVFI